MLKCLPASLALALFAAPAFAQGTAITPGQSIGNTPASRPTPPPATAPAPEPIPKVERTAKSKDCSMQADKQGLHGKVRKKFRSNCKAGRT